VAAIDIVSVGELLIDFTQAGLSPAGMLMFERNPGGAVANVAVAGARLGLRTAFIGKVGGDMHGRFLRETLEGEGVDTRNLLTDTRCATTLAFVALGEGGEREFSFHRDGTADLRLRADELDGALLAGARILHAGTLSLTAQPARDATLRAVSEAKAAGAVISCDVNFRASLWESEDEFCLRSRELLRETDLLKVSIEEAITLTGQPDCRLAADALADEYGVAVVAVTLGERGSYVLTRRGGVMSPGLRTEAVDTSGAGDAFWAAFLYSFARSNLAPSELDPDAASSFARFANAAASLCVERRGAIPAMPRLDEVTSRLARHGGGAL
jgi:fructokinase